MKSSGSQPVADPGPPSVLEQTIETRPPPPYLRVWITAPPPLNSPFYSYGWKRG